jgi:hypothetical protein
MSKIVTFYMFLSNNVSDNFNNNNYRG